MIALGRAAWEAGGRRHPGHGPFFMGANLNNARRRGVSFTLEAAVISDAPAAHFCRFACLGCALIRPSA